MGMVKKDDLQMDKDLDLDIDVYEVSSSTVLDSVGASIGWNSCSSVIKMGM